MLVDEIRKKLGFLFEHGFVVAEDANQADDWTVVLAREVLLLRMTHDRSDWFVDVGYTFLPDKWFELWDILAMLKKRGEFPHEYRATNKMSGIRSALHSAIEAMLQVDRYKEEVMSLKAI